MPNALTALGLTVSTRQEWLDYFTSQYQLIYGSDINLESDTPDGQFMNIMIQTILDLQDLLVQINNSFDPDFAIGNLLDQRVAINGIQRQAGTYTVTNITLVNSQSINLYGLDQDIEDVYTIADNAGNRWELIETEEGLAAGTHVLAFRAAEPGAQLTIPNTINVPVTIVLGVTSVNNPTAATTVGINEESDPVLRIRRQKSVSLASQGYRAGLLAALQNINGITSAEVYENTTNATDSDGTPGHTIWVIVAGTATDADIAQAIYTKRNAGAGMRGSKSYTITQLDGSPFIVYWDEVVTRDMFIFFTATSINGVTPPNIAAIRAAIPAGFVPGVNEESNINALATLVQEVDPNTLVTNAGLSSGMEQTFVPDGVAASGTFKIGYLGNVSAAIDWDDSNADILSKVQAVTGLSDIALTGDLTTQLEFDLTGMDEVLGLLYIVDNTLQTSGPVDVELGYNYDANPTLETTSKQDQFVASSANTVITPMLISSPSLQVQTTQSMQLTGLGGYGSYAWSLFADNSGASINASTGLYTAGSTPSVTDTVQVIDWLGNTAFLNISVV